MRAVAFVAHHQSLLEHELQQFQRAGIPTLLPQRFMHLAHGAGPLAPQHRENGDFGVGWKRRWIRFFGEPSWRHAWSVIRTFSYVNEIFRMCGSGDDPSRECGPA